MPSLRWDLLIDFRLGASVEDPLFDLAFAGDFFRADLFCRAGEEYLPRVGEVEGEYLSVAFLTRLDNWGGAVSCTISTSLVSASFGMN